APLCGSEIQWARLIPGLCCLMRPFVPRISNHCLRLSRIRRALSACLPGWYLLASNCGLIYSSRGERPNRVGESGGEREFPQQRQSQGVRPGDVGPPLTRTCGGAGGLCQDVFHLPGEEG